MLLWITFSIFVIYLILNFLLDPKKSKIFVTGKTVVITGGTQGLGLSIANECIRRGAKVALISRRAIDVANNESVEKSENRVISVSADVSDNVQLSRAMAEIREKFGEIDFIFTCAGLSRQEEVESLPDELVRQQINVNVIGTVNAVRLAIPEMKKRNSGRICIISSVAGQIGLWGMSAYCASKFALKGLAEAVQMEVLDTNVAVTIVYPPDMTTPGLEEENRTKPEIVRKISEMADEVHPDKIVKGLVDAVENGSVDYSVGIDGWFASRCSVGLGPASSCFNVLCELIFSNLFRFIGLVYRKLIFRVIRNGKKNE